MIATDIAGIVLAAGASTRMGRTKALLELDGVPFVRRVIDAHRRAGIERVIVVVGADGDAIRAALANDDVEVVTNPRWHEGRLASVIAGIDAVAHTGVEAIVLHPVDHPGVSSCTISALCDAFAVTGAEIVRPVCQQRRGHPVIFAARLFDELRNAPREVGVRAVVRAHADGIVNVTVDDEGILLNIDTPEDYDAVRRAVRCVA